MTYQMGQKLGNYKLVRLLGSGGFAEVYLARHIYLHTQAAIKVLQIQLTEDILQNFLKEARIIANLEHPNIVRVLEFGIEQHRPYLVMNYAPNGTLRQRYPRGRQLAPATVLTLVQQVVAALNYAHVRKIIHRDVKPENMLLSANTTLLLSDFGLALEGHSAYRSQPADQAGTMLYMAPEQFRGYPCAASDQYSLGIVAYEWLSGALPFVGTGLAIAVQHAHETPVPLHERVPALPVSLSNVVMRALQKEPEARFAQIQEFAAAFTEACHTHATLFSVPEALHPLSTALVEAQSAHISADTIARISAEEGTTHDVGRTLPFDSQIPQEYQLLPTMGRSYAQETRSPLAEQSVNMSLPVDETVIAVTLEVPTRRIQAAAEISSVTSSLVFRPQHQSRRKRTLLYGLGGLGLALCLSGIWEIHSLGVLPTAHPRTQHINAGIAKTVHSTNQNAGQNRPGHPLSTAENVPPATSFRPTGTTTMQTTRTQSLTQATAVTATTGHRQPTPSAPPPVITPTSAPTASSLPTPTASPTSLASPTPTPAHHGRPLSVHIASVPETVQNGSNVSVQITTNRGNCRVKLRVIYSDSSPSFRSSLTNTDSDGYGTIAWKVNIPRHNLLKYTFATLIATAYDSDDHSTFSLPVIVQIT
ncbi:MAG TPA: protein kinase [Ktedonobacteraceae bacterium]|nr:protein kinase [Ktedonobacteraceae bacterium]